LDHLAAQKMEIDQQHEKFKHEVQQIDNAKSKAKEMTKYLNQLRRELSEESKAWSQEAHNKTNELWDSVRQYEKLVQQSVRKGKHSEQSNQTLEHNESQKSDETQTERHEESQETTTQSQQQEQLSGEQQQPQISLLEIPQQDQQDEAQSHQDQHGHQLNQNQQDQDQPDQQQPAIQFPADNIQNANVHSSSVRTRADDRLNQQLPTIAIQPILV